MELRSLLIIDIQQKQTLHCDFYGYSKSKCCFGVYVCREMMIKHFVCLRSALDVGTSTFSALHWLQYDFDKHAPQINLHLEHIKFKFWFTLSIQQKYSIGYTSIYISKISEYKLFRGGVMPWKVLSWKTCILVKFITLQAFSLQQKLQMYSLYAFA